MLREINFTIFEKPIPQKRHRHTKTGQTYDPNKKDKLYYGILIKRAIEQHHSLKEHLLCGPISIDVKFYFELPTTKQARKHKGLYHTSKPDIDNLQKLLLDSLSNVLYADDAYIFRVTAIKCYTTTKARTEVVIKEVIQEQILENNYGYKDKSAKTSQMPSAKDTSAKDIIPARTTNQ